MRNVTFHVLGVRKRCNIRGVTFYVFGDRLLGDEAKGWLDTTYLSPQVRISRGNKGTTFILRRPFPPKA